MTTTPLPDVIAEHDGVSTLLGDHVALVHVIRHPDHGEHVAALDARQRAILLAAGWTLDPCPPLARGAVPEQQAARVRRESRPDQPVYVFEPANRVPNPSLPPPAVDLPGPFGTFARVAARWRNGHHPVKGSSDVRLCAACSDPAWRREVEWPCTTHVLAAELEALVRRLADEPDPFATALDQLLAEWEAAAEFAYQHPGLDHRPTYEQAAARVRTILETHGRLDP